MEVQKGFERCSKQSMINTFRLSESNSEVRINTLCGKIDHRISQLTREAPGDVAVWTTNGWPVLTFIMSSRGHI